MGSSGARSPAHGEAVERIVGATTGLCAGRSFDDLSVLDICNEAGISISSFYLRFPSKDDLLRELHSRYLHETRSALERRAAEVDWRGLDDGALVRLVVREYVALRVQWGDRFRTMALAEQRHEELGRARRDLDRIAIEMLADLFAARFTDPGTAREARRRAGFTARVAIAVTQDLTGLTRMFGFDDELGPEAVADQLGDLCVAYLATGLGD